MNYVIIGNSAAAVGCVEGIRSVDRTGPVTVISDEPYSVYSRPLISYRIGGKVTDEKMRYRPKSFYADNAVTPLLGKAAVQVDDNRKQVVLDGGETVPFDRLLFATGSRPFQPPMPGIEQVKHKFNFYETGRCEGSGRRPYARQPGSDSRRWADWPEMRRRDS